MADDFRKVLDCVMPRGPLWTPAPGGDLDLLLNGIAGCFQLAKDRLDDIRAGAFPLLVSTGRLPETLNEWGINISSAQEDIVRHECDLMTSGHPGGATLDEIAHDVTKIAGGAMVVASHGVIIPDDYREYLGFHGLINEWPDPQEFISGGFETAAGKQRSVAGYEGAQCGGGVGSLEYVIAASSMAVDAGLAQFAEDPADAYYVPVLPPFDPNAPMPNVVWIAEELIRDVTGTKIIAVVPLTVPAAGVPFFKHMIRKVVQRVKPVNSWAYVFAMEGE